MTLQRAKIQASYVHFELAKRHLYAGNLESAIAELQQTVDLNPSHQYAYVELEKALEQWAAERAASPRYACAENAEHPHDAFFLRSAAAASPYAAASVAAPPGAATWGGAAARAAAAAWGVAAPAVVAAASPCRRPHTQPAAASAAVSAARASRGRARPQLGYVAGRHRGSNRGR